MLKSIIAKDQKDITTQVNFYNKLTSSTVDSILVEFPGPDILFELNKDTSYKVLIPNTVVLCICIYLVQNTWYIVNGNGNVTQKFPVSIFS
jgi:hypothetical protein